MLLKSPAKAGTYESNDIYIMLFPHEMNKIELESTVIETYGEKIKDVITQILNDYGVTNVLVKATDKGALDYTVRARMKTALKRGGIDV